MAKGDQKIVDLPFQTWIVMVDQYNRVRFPLDEVRVLVPWLPDKSGPFECIAMPGASGGIELSPAADHYSVVAQFVEAMRDMQGPVIPGKWLDVARLMATVWLIKVNIEANRVSVTLPEPPRKAQLLPQAAGIAVVFAAAGIFEIWDAAKWNEYMRETAKRRAGLISEALEDLGRG